MIYRSVFINFVMVHVAQGGAPARCRRERDEIGLNTKLDKFIHAFLIENVKSLLFF
jgi:hypothetical protein